MKIQRIVVGPIETNCYIVSEGSDAVLVDPGDDADLILKELGGLKLKAILLTHLHFDHIIAVEKIKEETGAKVYCCKDDLTILDEKLLKQEEIDEFISEGSFLKIENCKLKIVSTPGHTPGSICLYDEKNSVLFSGDTIFAGSVGVTHFKGGDAQKLKNSVEKLLMLPDNTLVYPGHGEEFRLGDEKERISFMAK